jgi:hypothetical protein
MFKWSITEFRKDATEFGVTSDRIKEVEEILG